MAISHGQALVTQFTTLRLVFKQGGTERITIYSQIS